MGTQDGTVQVKDDRDDLQPAMQEIYDRASVEEQTLYLDLIRHDPAAGMGYLEALTLKQEADGATLTQVIPSGRRWMNRQARVQAIWGSLRA